MRCSHAQKARWHNISKLVQPCNMIQLRAKLLLHTGRYIGFEGSSGVKSRETKVNDKEKQNSLYI